jgi:hypothetical protein
MMLEWRAEGRQAAEGTLREYGRIRGYDVGMSQFCEQGSQKKNRPLLELVSL